MFEDETVDNPLTERQELFCHEYMVDLNQTRAYQRVFNVQNYHTAAGEASKLMNKNPKVSARIKQLMEQRIKELNINAEWVLMRLLQISDRSMQAEPVMKWNHEAKRMEETGEYVFDGNSANKSTELIGKHMGMFKERIELDANVNGELIITGKKFAQQPPANEDKA